MFNPWLSLGLKAWQIGLEAQSVIALRMMRIAAGGTRAEKAHALCLAAGRAGGSKSVDCFSDFF
jgi:hypothetical protein